VSPCSRIAAALLALTLRLRLRGEDEEKAIGEDCAQSRGCRLKQQAEGTTRTHRFNLPTDFRLRVPERQRQLVVEGSRDGPRRRRYPPAL
jgi:hypothetical protein